MVQAQGLLVDHESRCVHYHSDKDIVALQCYECKKYYACYQCHNELESHVFSPYPLNLKEEYTETGTCPFCNAAFNPACQNHYSIYFR